MTKNYLNHLLGMMLLLSGFTVSGQTTQSFISSGTWTCPAGVTSVTAQCWGAGGGGGGVIGAPTAYLRGAGGGAGGSYASSVVTVVPGNVYTLTVGNGGAGGDNTGSDGATGDNTWFGSATTVLAQGGTGGTGVTGSSGGIGGIGSSASCVGTTVYAGGNGANGAGGSNGGGGGGSAGSTGGGSNAAGYSGGSGGSGTSASGGNGYSSMFGTSATVGSAPGGGGGGGMYGSSASLPGTQGGNGQIILTYSTGASCDVPTGLTASNITSATADISFTAPATIPAGGYDYYLSTTNTAPVANTTPTGNITSSPFTIIGLTASTTYYVWIRSHCSATSQSVWTPTAVMFTTIAVCTIPTGVTASNITTTTTDVNFTAPATVPAGGYDYYVSTANTAPAANTTPTGNIASSPFTISSLTASTTYYLWIRSHCSAASQSAWTTAVMFTTTAGCTAPTGLTTSNITGATADVSFAAPATIPAGGYDYYVSTTNTTPTANATPTGNITSSPFTISGLLASTTYYAWLRSHCGAGSVSSWIGPVSFMTSASTSNPSQSFTSSGTWTCPAGVTSMTVQCWGAGGGGGGVIGAPTAYLRGAGGGAGGSYASSIVTVVPGNVYILTVGNGGAGGDNTGSDGATGDNTWFGSATTVLAQGGTGGTGVTGSLDGIGGIGSSASCAGTTIYGGGNGANGAGGSNGGGGGSSAGSTGIGSNASGYSGGNGGSGGASGGNGYSSMFGSAATVGGSPGGGGGGGMYGSSTSIFGKQGGNGQIILTYSTPLLITFEYFRGRKMDKANHLEWKINSNETNNTIMTLERSVDGKQFEPLKEQELNKENSNSAFEYDDDAFKSGANYYRIKLLSTNGKIAYSQIVTLVNNAQTFELISIIPNPVKEQSVLQLVTGESGKVKIVVSDVVGRVLINKDASTVEGINNIGIDCSLLNAGTYQISVVNDSGILKTTRFVKN